MKNNIWLDGFRSVARMGETAVVAAKAGIKYATEKPSNAKLMRETFESLGSTYIKLGQFIASTPSLFPREYVEEFQGCLDQTPSLPFSYVQQVLASAFAGRDLSQIFASIDETPLASASIAQVHAAKLVTGESVVLKVQKPGVETILYTDLNVLHWATKILEKVVPKVKFASLADIVDEIKTRMVREVDFIEEAQNIDDFAKSKAAAAIMPNASIKWILRQKGADRERLKSVLHLNDREVQLIDSLSQVKGKFSESFLMCDDDKGIVSIEATPLEYWLATTDPKDFSLMNQIENQTGFQGEELLRHLADKFPKGAERI